jgi:hypothetical protein
MPSDPSAPDFLATVDLTLLTVARDKTKGRGILSKMNCIPNETAA